MKKILLSMFAGSLLFANGVSDSDIGLRKHSLDDEKKLQIQNFNYSTKEAGESERFERAYLNAPPQIPHIVEDFLPITSDNNMCVSCHDLVANAGAETLEAGSPTPMPKSHYYDFRENKQLEELSQARFNCVQCHTPQAELKPLVENTFKPDFKGDNDKKHRSNLLDVLNEGIK